jgi:hypothetical protein
LFDDFNPHLEKAVCVTRPFPAAIVIQERAWGGLLQGQFLALTAR